MKLAEEAVKKTPEAQKASPGKDQPAAQSKVLRASIDSFMTDVSFGVGRIWRPSEPPLDRGGAAYELLGALLTGLLVSIGAPYWHDLLRALASLRTRKEG